jgi:NADH-quinone oxidoreductase subunit I
VAINGHSAARRLWIYARAVVKGVLHTTWRFFADRPRFTLAYPFVRLPTRKGYRGEHRLKKDEQGRPKCVACFMCSTACPAECITIEAGASPWPDRDKVPVRFEIDMLKCIYCGMCEEACPCDAIELTEKYNQVAVSRQEKIYDLRRLLSN